MRTARAPLVRHEAAPAALHLLLVEEEVGWGVYGPGELAGAAESPHRGQSDAEPAGRFLDSDEHANPPKPAVGFAD
jgi:hypothetical protein